MSFSSTEKYGRTNGDQEAEHASEEAFKKITQEHDCSVDISPQVGRVVINAERVQPVYTPEGSPDIS